MKKIIATLGLSALLIGCFEVSKETDSTPKVTEQAKPKEKNERQVSVSDNADEARKADVKLEDDKSEERGKPENTSDNTPPANETATSKVLEDVVSPAEQMKKESPVVAKFATGERIKAETLLIEKNNTSAKKSEEGGRNTYINVKTLNTPKQKVLVEKHPEGTYENGQFVSNFSLEELRVGAQIPMSATEIVHQKVRCRYPNMSEKDIKENNCEPKQVTVSY